jgi:hypothetical protein
MKTVRIQIDPEICGRDDLFADVDELLARVATERASRIEPPLTLSEFTTISIMITLKNRRNKQ